MADLKERKRRRRWCGPALGGRLQRGVRLCFSAYDGEATTPTLSQWCRPEIVHAGGKVKKWHFRIIGGEVHQHADAPPMSAMNSRRSTASVSCFGLKE
jgi:hypothetical protein